MMKKFYITTPIYYINAEPHIGHCYTTISCDILARYHKLKNEEVYFLTGTDEHGQKVEKAANLKKIDPKDFADNISESFIKLVKFLNCDTNDFIRTTENRHIKSAQSLWKILEENNQIYKGNYEGWYSVIDEAFYDEKELIKKENNYFAPSGSKVEWVEEESYFFKLSNWSEKLLEHYNNNSNFIQPKTRYNEVYNFVKSGLRDLSISRSTFKWGIPIPNDKNHVMYVWLDALQNYLSALEFPNINSDLYKKFWPGIHIVGKDILRFHAVYWPAFLMAANLEPPKEIFAHGWWTNNDQKISKSTGNIIDPYKLINKFGLDEVRYFLFREVPFGEDGDFSEKAIINRINNDLANDYGNLVQRVCAFISKNCNKTVENNFILNKTDNEIINQSNDTLNEYIKFMDSYQIDKSLKKIFELISLSNSYIDYQAPWNLRKTDKNRMNVVLSILVELIKRIAILSFPIMPIKSNKILNILNLDIKNLSIDDYSKLPINSYKINDPEPIFPKYEI